MFGSFSESEKKTIKLYSEDLPPHSVKEALKLCYPLNFFSEFQTESEKSDQNLDFPKPKNTHRSIETYLSLWEVSKFYMLEALEEQLAIQVLCYLRDKTITLESAPKNTSHMDEAVAVYDTFLLSEEST